ncbi:MAG: GGDEF domain-containing response regulator [Gemmatimonas sp.]
MSDEVIRILLVEDDEDDHVLTRELLVDGFGSHFSLNWVQDTTAGLEELTMRTYDVALVDYNLGTDTGIELLRAAVARGCRTPVIMLTGQNDRATDLEAMHSGAADYLVKGRVTGGMLERSVRYARERHRLMEEISALSLTDELTGLSNRRGFCTMADQRLQLLERRESPCMLVFCDVDGLKQANDKLGHEAGDRLLLDSAKVLRTAFRATDLVARLGGDEFVVLADDVSERVEFVVDRLERHIAARNASAGPDAAFLSISVGALAFRAGPSIRLADLIAQADVLMLECKAGRRHSGKGSARRTQPRLMAIQG